MDLNEKQLDQVTRILMKLDDIALHDSDFKIFGASTHQYEWSAPASGRDIIDFEEKYNVQLPKDYKIFMGFISNGGPFVGHGLYALDKVEIVGSLSAENILYPHMDKGDFSALVNTLEIEMKKDPTDVIYNGLLIIGTEGCTYDIALVVTGKYKGRLVLTDGNLDNPFIYSYDMNFLDLYEKWLDVFVEGKDPTKVLLPLQEDCVKLVERYKIEDDVYMKREIIRTLHTYEQIEDSIINSLRELVECEESLRLKSELLHLVNRFDVSFAQEAFKAHLYSGELNVVNHFVQYESSIYEFRDADYKRMSEVLQDLSNVVREDEYSTFEMAIRLLKGSSYDKFEVLEPFLSHSNPDVRVRTISLIAESSDFRPNKNKLLRFLDDEVSVVREVLFVLINSTMSDEYLEVFKDVVEKHSDDDYVLSLIERYLHKIKVDLDYYA